MIDAILGIIPSWQVPAYFYLLYAARFEAQRFQRSFRKPHPIVVGFIGWTWLLSSIFSYMFLVAFAVDFSILGAVILYLGSMLLGLVEEFIWPRHDNLALQLGSSGATYPLMWLLFSEVSWFGFS